jgi:hypothetical protein
MFAEKDPASSEADLPMDLLVNVRRRAIMKGELPHSPRATGIGSGRHDAREFAGSGVAAGT